MQIEETTDPDIIGALEAALLDDLARSQPQGVNETIALVTRHQGRIVAGLTGSVSYGWLLIKVLLVQEEHRGQGLGKALIARAERCARKHKCHAVWLDTSSRESLGFYERLGFSVFGRLENHAGTAVPGHQRWFLKRDIEVGES